MMGSEFKSIKSLKENKYIRILQADKGKYTVVLDDSEYKHTLNSLWESGGVRAVVTR
jgi:vacuolar-type H+-ATPase subunit C/Vma6